MAALGDNLKKESFDPLLMSYLKNYLYYGSGHECPESFQLWSALSLIGAVVGRKVWVKHGDYFTIYPNIYVCLVGTAGSGKSTARSTAKTIFVKAFPTHMVSASIQSREDIAQQMASEDCAKYWKDLKGEYGDIEKIYEYRPFYIVANELASFLSVDKGKMVEFLVDIYDENYFSTGFKGQRKANPEAKQWFENPYVSMIACAVPKWFMSNLKLDLFDGGLGRRLFIVYDEKSKLVDDPKMPEGGDKALQAVIDHLLKLGSESFYGEIKRNAAAMAWWKKWYHDPKRFNREDPILMQFHETKAVQLLKVASLLCLSEDPPNMTMDEGHLEAAKVMIDRLEPNVLKLTSGIGRNEIAGVGAEVLDYIGRMGGMVPEVALKKFFHRYLNTPEFKDLLQHYIETEQLYICEVEIDGIKRRAFFLKENYTQYVKTKMQAESKPSLLS